MKLMVTGHRIEKLEGYDIDQLKADMQIAIDDLTLEYGWLYGLSGMASGVDLWFLDIFKFKRMTYACYIPFDEQTDYMSKEDALHRQNLISTADRVYRKTRNIRMVEDCDLALIVYDGKDKGGTWRAMQKVQSLGKPYKLVTPTRI
jgi:hypothetical protein